MYITAFAPTHGTTSKHNWGGGFLARVDARLVEQAPAATRSLYGDVRVAQRSTPGPSRTIAPASGVALAEPITIEVSDEKATEGYIQIIDVPTGGRVITVIEFLSTTNKLPPTRTNTAGSALSWKTRE